jgi:hypothetical protein
MITPSELLAARPRNEPHRDSTVYPRLMNVGGWQRLDKRPLIKPTPANLRMFGKTPFARQAIKRIKNPIAALPWEVGPKKDVKLNSTLQAQIDIATTCFRQPNHDDSFRTLIEQLIEDMCTNGAGCYEQQLGGDAVRPLWLWTVDSLSIQINAAWNGKAAEARYFQTLGYGNIGGVQGKALRNDELVYIRQDPTTENPFGLGELEVAFAAINRKLGVADYAGKLASNTQPENLLVFEGMSQEILQTYRNYWRNEIEGQGQTPMISPPAGSKADVLKLHGTDDTGLFIKYQELLIREIATSFGLSPMNFGIEHDVNRNTAEVSDDSDWENAVVPKATNISAYITRETIEGLLGFSQLEFRFLGLKRDDKMAEAEIYKLEYENNAVTPNEYRARNNMEPSNSEWADLNYADVQIAQSAARGSAVVEDRNLGDAPTKPKPKSKSKSQSQRS